jgi:hypothetical protein
MLMIYLHVLAWLIALLALRLCPLLIPYHWLMVLRLAPRTALGTGVLLLLFSTRLWHVLIYPFSSIRCVNLFMLLLQITGQLWRVYWSIFMVHRVLDSLFRGPPWHCLVLFQMQTGLET